MSEPKLEDVILCPDCGGVVGATAATEHGQPCTCFTARKSSGADAGANGNGESAAPAVKVCALCGKDVSGQKRFRDSRGYLCQACNVAENARAKPSGVRCPKCGRHVKPETIDLYEGQKMCQRCMREAKAEAAPGSKRYRKIDTKGFEEADKSRLFIMAGVLGVLALIIILNRLGWI